MEVFITKRNLDRIISKVDSSVIKDFSLYDRKINFLSEKEIIELLKVKSVLSNREEIQIYKHVEEDNEEVNDDNFVFLYKKRPPSYHNTPNCERLNADFVNYKIPKSIITNARKKAVKRRFNVKQEQELINRDKHNFRTWFNENIKLIEEDENSFVTKMQAQFMISDGVEEVRIANTGNYKFTNINLDQLVKAIDTHINKANEFIRRYNNRGIIYLFNSVSSEKELEESNNTNLSDQELEIFYKQYDLQFKKPIKELLKQYYMVKFNPNLSFDGKLLDQLGFKPCSHCCNSIALENVA